MAKTVTHTSPRTVRDVAMPRTVSRRAHGVRHDTVNNLGELFRELRAWDVLSAESLRTHGF